MGCSYAFEGDAKSSTIERAASFMRAIDKISNRRATILGTVQNKRSNKWRTVVEVCGAENSKVTEIARKYQ